MSKRLIAIVVAASLALGGLWYFALWAPQSKSLKKTNGDVAAAKAQQATLRGEIATLQKQKLDLPAKQEKLASLKLALPDTPALDKLIDDINAAAVASGVDWQSITPAKPSTFTAGSAQAVAAGFPGGMQGINVAMQVNGSYTQLLDFVNKLNGMSRLLDVVSFNLSGVGAQAVKATAQITSQIFFVPPVVASAPAVVTTTTVVR